MGIKYIRKAAYVLIGLLFANILYVTALAAIPMDVSSIILYEDYVVQDKDQWCWAASAENAIIWEGSSSRTQWDAVKHLKGTLFEPYPNVSGSIYDSASAAEYISNNTETYTAVQAKKTYSFLGQQIENRHPIIVGAGYYNSSGSRNGGHATLIIGYRIDGIEGITYYDSLTGTTETCTYAQFCDGSYNGRKYDQTCYNTTP